MINFSKIAQSAAMVLSLTGMSAPQLTADDTQSSTSLNKKKDDAPARVPQEYTDVRNFSFRLKGNKPLHPASEGQADYERERLDHVPGSNLWQTGPGKEYAKNYEALREHYWRLGAARERVAVVTSDRILIKQEKEQVGYLARIIIVNPEGKELAYGVCEGTERNLAVVKLVSAQTDKIRPGDWAIFEKLPKKK